MRNLLSESFCCGLAYVRYCHAKGSAMLVGKVTVMNVQGVYGGVACGRRCVRWSIHGRSRLPILKDALDFQDMILMRYKYVDYQMQHWRLKRKNPTYFTLSRVP